ncbi:YfiT family bacillithiol transferase [Gemmatimonadota bacterium]
MDRLRYPSGPFLPQPDLTPQQRDELIEEIAHFPADLRFVVSSLTGAELDTPYREGGWTLRQVVHHLPDSHVNAYVRFKLAMTEDAPTIKAYDEAAWAETEEARTAPVEISLDLMDGLHKRWVLLLRALAEEDFARTLNHPEAGLLPLDVMLQLYAWHGRHHLGHIGLVAEE